VTTPDDQPPSRVRVLYVNDDEAFSELVRTKLERQNPALSVRTVTDRAAALSELEDEKEGEAADCLVTAYRLPEGTGIDLARAVQDRDAELPVILFTGDGGERIAAETTRAGLADYIPIRAGRDDFELLARRIRTLVTAARDRKRAAMTAARLERTLERTTDAVYAVDTEWRIEYMNERMADRVDRDPDAVVGNTLWAEFPAIVGTELEERYRTAMETGEPMEFEQYLDEPYDYWVEVRAFPDEDGLTVFSRDVTEERERERELERVNRRFEALFAHTDEAVYVKDRDGHYRMVNEAAADLFGADVDEVVGAHDEELFDAESAAAIREVDEAILESGEPDTREAVRYIDGRRHVFLDNKYPYRDADGDIVGIMGISRDITERRRREGELERERDALRALQTVMAKGDLSTDDRLQRLLVVGCEALALDVGIVARIEGDDYEVRAVHAPDAEMAAGDEFALGSTYCREVVAADAVQSFPDAAAAGHEAHPAYQEFGLSAYIGVPLVVDGDRFGTLNFSSPDVRERSFSDFERTLVRLLAEVVSAELTRGRERRRVEQTNRRLESLFDTAPLSIVELEPDGTVRRWNRGAEEMFGWTAEEVVGEPNPLIPESRQVEYQQILDRVLDGETIRQREVRRETKDGSDIDLLLSVAPVEGGGGRDAGDVGVLAVIEDISSQKRMERQLRALQLTAQQLSAAEDRAEIGDIAVGAATEVLGLDITGIWRHDPQADVLEPITETLAARELFGDPPRFEPGDSLAWTAFETGEMRVYDDVSEVEGRLNPDTPIGAEMLVPLGEYGLMATGSTSEREFSGRERDLFRLLGSTVEAAMERAEREAELRRQNERLDEFASVVAHDLRNPLSVAEGFLDLARESDDPADFERVESAHDRIGQLTEDLLTLARGETTVSDAERVPVADVAREAWGYVDTNGASLQVPDDLGMVAADPGRLTQLFENCFRNAAEHAGDAPTVRVGSLTDADGFYVADDGPGIPPDRREDVLEYGVSYEAGGTGFGLSIVSDIAGAHGWAVTVTESETGGARFEFAAAD
jgi:PAS domain S-box-containing protein